MTAPALQPGLVDAPQAAPSLWTAGFLACLAVLSSRKQATPPSPWYSPVQAAPYAHVHKDTIYDALHEFVSSKGKRGLRGYQRDANCKWLIHRDDLDAWVRGEQPGRQRPLRSVS